MKRLSVFLLLLCLMGLTLMQIPFVKANSNSITYDLSTNVITVKGYTTYPYCNTTEIWEADLEGSILNLDWNSTPYSDGLEVQIRPADSIELTLNITIANYSVPKGDITLNGTDMQDNFQTESIEINANGVYITTLSYKAINPNSTGIVATGTYDFKIEQNRWGVVYKLPETEGFLFDASLRIGYYQFLPFPPWGIAEIAYFKTTNEYIEFSSGNGIYVDVGFFFSGEIMTNGTTHSGSTFKGNAMSTNFGYIWFYNSKLIMDLRISAFSNLTMIDCIVTAMQFYPTDVILERVTIYGNLQPLSKPTTRWDTVRIGGSVYEGLWYVSQSNLDVELYDIYIDDTPLDTHFESQFGFFGNNYVALVDSLVVDNVNVTNSFGGSSGNITLANVKTFNVVVHDGSDLPIENATVTVRDVNGTIVFSLLTNSTGQIPEQLVIYNDWYYHNDTYQSGIWREYFPLNITITKTDYISYSTNITMPSTQIEGITLKNLPLLMFPEGYAGFSFLFFGLLIGLVVGLLIGYGSKK